LVNEFSSRSTVNESQGFNDFVLFWGGGCLIDIGMDKEFDSILAMVTEKISSTGEVDVDAALHFKNPPSQPPGRIPLFPSRSSVQ
jgi:hypothetical protein